MFNNPEVNKVVNNFVSLLLNHGVELLLPLILLPIFVKSIGIELFGLINFSAAIIGYFGIIMNYGFNLSATKEVAKVQNDYEKISKIYNVVNCTKIFLVLLCIFIFIILYNTVDFIKNNVLLYVLTFLYVIFQNLTSFWLFHGLQILKKVVYVSMFVKAIIAILLIFLLEKKSDYLLIPILYLVQNVLVFLFASFYIRFYLKIKFEIETMSNIKSELRNGVYIFLSQVKISFFSNFNTIIIGLLIGNTAVGLFNSADKIIKGISAVQVPVVASLYPFLSRKFSENIPLAFNYIKKIAIYGILLCTVFLVVVWFLLPYVTEFLFSNISGEIILYSKILLIIPLFVFLNNLFGTQVLLNLGKDKIFFNILLTTAIVNVILILPMTYMFGLVGSCIAIVVTELYLCLASYFMMKRVKNLIL